MNRARAGIGAALLVAACAGVARGQSESDTPASWRISIAPAVGALMLDSHLADYRWDTSVSVQPGLRIGVHHSRYSAALRTSWSAADQSTGLIGESTIPRVHMTQLDLALEGRIATLARIELWGSAHGGRMFLGYEPEQMTVDAGGSPVTVSFDPIDEWCYGAGIAFRRDLARHLALGLQLDGTGFQLDTAHRNGSEIVESREGFVNWSLSVALLGFMDLDRAQ
ncbi:MAG TPA: hypothetical protein VFH33_00485 [Candidatus Krumholzibacteria bacterium]|nr:hypothetical protein [Candidatus Krumholzibacteria bacterium]